MPGLGALVGAELGRQGGGDAGGAPDLLVQLPNAAATYVGALELMTVLTDQTAALEAGRFTVRVISGGVLVPALTIDPNWVLVPAGSSRNAGVRFVGLQPGHGIYAQPLDTSIRISFDDLVAHSNDWKFSNGGISFERDDGVALDGQIGLKGTTSLLRSFSSNLFIYASDQANDVCIGKVSGGALAQNATGGFLSIPRITVTAAQKPTGAPGSGALAPTNSIAWDYTNKTLCIYDHNSAAWYRLVGIL